MTLRWNDCHFVPVVNIRTRIKTNLFKPRYQYKSHSRNTVVTRITSIIASREQQSCTLWFCVLAFAVLSHRRVTALSCKLCVTIVVHNVKSHHKKKTQTQVIFEWVCVDGKLLLASFLREYRHPTHSPKLPSKQHILHVHSKHLGSMYVCFVCQRHDQYTGAAQEKKNIW